MLRRGAQCRFLRRREEAHRNPADGAAGAQLCILDETDSGLDIDALRIVADGVNALRSPDRAMLVITHYQRLLDYIVPDFVHVMSKGKVVEERRQGAGAGARDAGYAEFETRPERDTDVVMNVILAKTETAHAKAISLAVARDRLPGAGKVAELEAAARWSL